MLTFVTKTQFKHGLFRIVTPNASSVIVVSPSFLGELQKLPDDVVSFDAAIDEVSFPPLSFSFFPFIPSFLSALTLCTFFPPPRIWSDNC